AFRFLYALVAPLDALLDQVQQGLASWFPGRGTPTALPYIGRSRGIIRNQGESEASYAERLGRWLDTWPEAASQELIAVAIHQFLATHPRVRVITRSGLWLTCEADGTIVRTEAAWDWDSISHPQRNDPDAPWWSDMWIVVQLSPWAQRPGTLGDLTGDDGFALGHLATHPEVDAIKGLIAQWKGAHSRVRAVIWTTDATLFDPEEPASCPNGRWGAWGIYDGTSYVPSDRNITTCRYWEPR
ncbi:MAG: hypothetical protein QOG85_862, partial [Gaiellaceae bacterium]|nr:hypothetical protein [Gaiellaceae bacterium]